MPLKKICFYIFLLIAIPIILFYGAPLLVPLAVAIVLAMMLNPAIDKLINWGVNENLAIGLSTFLVVAIGVGIVLAVIGQASTFANDWNDIQVELSTQWEQLQKNISLQTGIDVEIVKDKLSLNSERLVERFTQRVTGIAGSMIGTVANTFLILVYLIFLLMERHRFTRFIFKITDDNRTGETHRAIDDMLDVAQGYLVGKLALIAILAVVYSIGFVIIGLKYGIFLAILAAVLSIIPYLGNIIGGALALLAAIATGGGIGAVLGVTVVMGIAQFIESYIVQPFLVGSKVNINPFFTIISVVAFGVLWGVVGTILAIPLIGIMKVIFDHLDRFKPLGYVMGDE